MGNSVIERLSTPFTDASLPRLYRDPILNTGSMFLFDFLDGFSNPNGDGNLAAGASFANLVDGAPGATIVGTTASFASLSGRAGLAIPGATGAAGTANYVDLGTSYNLAALNHDFLMILWLKTVASGFTTGYPQILVQGPFSNEGNDQVSITMGSDGKTPRGSVANSTGTGASASGASGAGLGAVQQLAMFRAGSTLALSLNNVAVTPQTVIPGTGLYDVSSSGSPSTKIGAAYKGTMYRAYKEDLTVSAAAIGSTPAAQAAAQIAADYAANASRFA